MEGALEGVVQGVLEGVVDDVVEGAHVVVAHDGSDLCDQVLESQPRDHFRRVRLHLI